MKRMNSSGRSVSTNSLCEMGQALAAMVSRARTVMELVIESEESAKMSG